MISNIVFDMGRVLVEYDTSRFVGVYLDNAEDRELVTRELFQSVEWVKLDRGSITEEQALREVCLRLPERLHQKARDLLENWHNYIPPQPEMDELCARLKQSGYKLYLLSNTSLRFYKYRHNIPALKHFDGEFVSADWNLLKPDEAIYRTFCQHFSLIPSQCFFIDDLPANIESAMRVGMRGFIFHGSVPDLEIALKKAGVNF